MMVIDWRCKNILHCQSLIFSIKIFITNILFSLFFNVIYNFRNMTFFLYSSFLLGPILSASKYFEMVLIMSNIYIRWGLYPFNIKPSWIIIDEKSNTLLSFKHYIHNKMTIKMVSRDSTNILIICVFFLFCLLLDH